MPDEDSSQENAPVLRNLYMQRAMGRSSAQVAQGNCSEEGGRGAGSGARGLGGSSQATWGLGLGLGQ